METVVLIGRHDFGENTDFYEFFKNIDRSKFNVLYYCTGIRLGFSALEGVVIIDGCRRQRDGISFSLRVIKMLRENPILKKSTIWVNQYYGCFVLGLLHRGRAISDIRSGAIGSKWVELKNRLIWFDSLWFNHVTVVSMGVADHLKINKKKSIVPLGAVDRGISNRGVPDDGCIRFIYVGVFDNRGIDVLVRSFLNSSMSYRAKLRIIGFGSEFEVSKIKKEISSCDCVEFVGYVPYEELGGHYAVSDVGVSYIPMVKMFDLQPPTKTFEYLMNGLPVVATRTRANECVVSAANGYLVNDSECDLIQFFNEFDPNSLPTSWACRDSVKALTWGNITRHYVEPLFINDHGVDV